MGQSRNTFFWLFFNPPQLTESFTWKNKIKISFGQYLDDVRYHLRTNKKPIRQFWGFKSARRIESDTVFDIPYKDVLYAPQKQLENEILYMYHHCEKKEGYEIL